jgi:hypothetical protein
MTLVNYATIFSRSYGGRPPAQIQEHNNILQLIRGVATCANKSTSGEWEGHNPLVPFQGLSQILGLLQDSPLQSYAGEVCDEGTALRCAEPEHVLAVGPWGCVLLLHKYMVLVLTRIKISYHNSGWNDVVRDSSLCCPNKRHAKWFSMHCLGTTGKVLSY